MAANLGRGLSEEDYEKRFELWLKEDSEREKVKAVAGQRFQASYWDYCPLYVCLLSAVDQKTLMVRLNNQNQDGRDDPAKMAAILGQLPKEATKDSGWDIATAAAFKDAFLQRAPEPEPEPENEPDGYQFDEGMEAEGGTEREYGEVFERPDATDYDGSEEDNPWERDATEESGPVTVAGGDGETYQVVSESGDIEDKDAQNVFKHSGGHYSDTRVILYVSYQQNDDWKDLCKVAADALGVDRVGEIAKIWRTQAAFGVMDWFMKHHPQAATLWAEHQAQAAAESEAAEYNLDEVGEDGDSESTPD